MTPHIQKLIKQPLNGKGKGPCITSTQEPITRSEQHFKALFSRISTMFMSAFEVQDITKEN